MDSILIYTSVFSVVFPVSMGFSITEKDNVLIKILFFLLGSSMISDFVCLYMYQMTAGSTLAIIQTYGLIESILLFLLYYHLLNKSRLVTFVAIVFISYYAFDSFSLEGVRAFNSTARAIQAFIFIFLSVVYFVSLFRRDDDIFLDRNLFFWINTAVIFYFSGAFFSFLLSQSILYQPIAWKLHNIANILKNILFAIGLWKTRTT